MSRKFWIWAAALIFVAAGAGAAIWTLRDDFAYAQIASGYAAKQTCSCVHVSGRPLSSCIGEFPPEARGQIEVSQDGEVVRASVLFGVISAEARYEEGFGCSATD